jgi:hypothetical protein
MKPTRRSPTPTEWSSNPTRTSKSGRGVRIIGYSITAQAVLTVIVLDEEGTTYGANVWKANPKDQRRYEGTEES